MYYVPKPRNFGGAIAPPAPQFGRACNIFKSKLSSNLIGTTITASWVNRVLITNICIEHSNFITLKNNLI